jgi:poly(3-hydroxybutyrate) depolymerase
MIAWLRAHYDIDPRRIYVDGLSAGGWFVPELLADYPDVFAGGATHAGGPAFCAGVQRPFWDWFGWWTTMTGGTLAAQCMRGVDLPPRDWAERARVQAPSGWRGAWPVLSIWQGSADHVVAPSSQSELLEQWTDLHGADATADFSEQSGTRNRVLHQRFNDASGRAVVETWRIDGMTHGIAMDAAPGARCGEASAFVLDVGICAVRRIGAFWGL